MRIERQEKDDCIAKQADTYPKTFFVDPRQRVSLKKNIAADIERDGFAAAGELISATVDWYQSHFGYLTSLQAGSPRVDIHGKLVGTVTETEARAAFKKVADIKREQTSPVAVLGQLHANKQISDDAVKKLDAPQMRRTNESLKLIHEALAAADAALMNTDIALNLRNAMAVAALGIVVTEAQQAIDKLKKHEK